MTTTTDLITPRQNLELAELAELLQAQHARKHDLVVPASDLVFAGGKVRVPDGYQAMSLDGVTTTDLVLDPTFTFDGQFASKFDVPVRWIRQLRERSIAEGQPQPDEDDLVWDPEFTGTTDELPMTWTALLDHTWARAANPDADHRHPNRGANRSVLVRSYVDDTGHGVARALLSDRYGIIDNFDVLLAALDALRDSGMAIEVVKASLTERKMSVHLFSPDVSAMAPELLRNYRNPFERTGHGQEGLRDENGNLPVMFAGFRLDNSETGGSQFTLTPELRVKICNNGLVINKDTVARTHLGAKLDAGVVRWSDDTRKANIELVKSTTRDIAMTFMDHDYLVNAIRDLEAKAGVEVTHPAKTIEVVSKALGFTEAEADTILSCFVKGGQMTSGGVMNAVTAAAQLIDNPDRAEEVGALGVEAMEVVTAA